MRIGEFASVTEYVHFCWAKKFCYAEDINREFPSHWVERLSNIALSPIQEPLHKILESNARLFFAIVGITGVVMETCFFYPEETFGLMKTMCSPVFVLEPWMVKLGLYLASEGAITALMTRTFSRLNNTELIKVFTQHNVIPIHLGHYFSKTES